MVEPAVVGRAFVLVHAADAAAVQVAQAAGILHRLPERGRFAQGFRRFLDVAPEHPEAHAHRDEGVEESEAEQQGHGVMRHQAIEGARSRVGGEQDGGVAEGDETQDEGRDAESGDDADRQPVALERAGEGRGQA